jgi:PIN domain nuclease of toxin-antitoxin system
MILLLDTNAFIWWINDDVRLGKRARADIASPLHKVYVSNLTLFECSIKVKIKKLKIDFDLVDEAISHGQFYELRFDTQVARQFVAELELEWADPFDAALIAQAIAKRMTLVTSDYHILKSSLAGLQVIDARK